MNGVRILITGGAGFIGSALIRYLINNENAKILNIDKLTYAGNLASLKLVDNSPDYQFIKGDICDFELVKKTVQEFKPQYIMHLAAETHVDRSINGAREFINTNINGTFNMLEAAREYWNMLEKTKKDKFRFLHISTDEVYGSLGPDGLFSETTAYDPSSPYSASKAASDHLVKAWYKTYGFPVLISNCSNNYGPYQFPEKLIPLNLINALENKSMNVYGKGENIRDWLYVDDHARALYLIISKGRLGETYNVGGRNERSNIDVITKVCKILDKLRPNNLPHSRLINFVADRPGNDLRYAIDAEKLETELGWKAQENFESGLEKTIHWYLDNEDWWQPLRNNVYSGERLGKLK